MQALLCLDLFGLPSPFLLQRLPVDVPDHPSSDHDHPCPLPDPKRPGLDSSDPYRHLGSYHSLCQGDTSRVVDRPSFLHPAMGRPRRPESGHGLDLVWRRYHLRDRVRLASRGPCHPVWMVD